MSDRPCTSVWREPGSVSFADLHKHEDHESACGHGNGEQCRLPLPSPFTDVEPQFSPDGKFVAYVSGATGRHEVYVQPFPATGESWPISNTGGRQPQWRQDGKELFFVNDDRRVYAVDINLEPKFDYGEPRFLVEIRANVYNVRNSYIPGPDGRRFLVNMALDTAAPPLHVVRGWAAGLKE